MRTSRDLLIEYFSTLKSPSPDRAPEEVAAGWADDVLRILPTETLAAALDLAEAQIAQALALAPRSWDVHDADSAESREARAYNFALQQVQAIFR